MKPIIVNLASRKYRWADLRTVAAFLLVCAALGFTGLNLYDYSANKRVIRQYESRLDKMEKRAQEKQKLLLKAQKKEKDREKSKEKLDYLYSLIKKNLFSLPLVLTELERVKPEKIEIMEVQLSKDLKTANIVGKTGYVESVSTFLRDLDQSPYFSIDLARGSVDSDRNIRFTLKTNWMPENANPNL